MLPWAYQVAVRARGALRIQHRSGRYDVGGRSGSGRARNAGGRATLRGAPERPVVERF